MLLMAEFFRQIINKQLRKWDDLVDHAAIAKQKHDMEWPKRHFDENISFNFLLNFTELFDFIALLL